MAAEKLDKTLNEELRQDQLEHFVRTETECCLCGSPVLAKHDVNYMTLQIHETLDCVHCKVTLKNTTNTLH